MKRVVDLLLTFGAAVVLVVPLILVAVSVRLTSRGPVLYWSDRVGRNNQIFQMPKFRSMRVGTPAVATRQCPQRRARRPRTGHAPRRAPRVISSPNFAT